jgi:hypothetical protein
MSQSRGGVSVYLHNLDSNRFVIYANKSLAAALGVSIRTLQEEL